MRHTSYPELVATQDLLNSLDREDVVEMLITELTSEAYEHNESLISTTQSAIEEHFGASLQEVLGHVER